MIGTAEGHQGRRFGKEIAMAAKKFTWDASWLAVGSQAWVK